MTEPRRNERGEPLTKVWLAYPWTDPETGRTHAPDTSVEVDTGTAASLIGQGLARDTKEQPQPVGETIRVNAPRGGSKAAAAKRAAATAKAAAAAEEGASDG